MCEHCELETPLPWSPSQGKFLEVIEHESQDALEKEYINEKYSHAKDITEKMSTHII